MQPFLSAPTAPARWECKRQRGIKQFPKNRGMRRDAIPPRSGGRGASLCVGAISSGREVEKKGETFEARISEPGLKGSLLTSAFQYKLRFPTVHFFLFPDRQWPLRPDARGGKSLASRGGGLKETDE